MASGAAPPAAAAAANAAPVVGEVIVTAQKRSERLRDVPLSITAASGEQLAKQGISGPADLEKIAPGFTYRLSQNGTPVFSIGVWSKVDLHLNGNIVGFQRAGGPKKLLVFGSSDLYAAVADYSSIAFQDSSSWPMLSLLLLARTSGSRSSCGSRSIRVRRSESESLIYFRPAAE